MTSEPDTPRFRINRLAQNDPLHRLVEQAYRTYDSPAPRHVPGCGCALCSDRGKARELAMRAARDWTADEVRGWFERVSAVEGGRTGLQVASRTDRAVFRFLLPRVLELMATATLPIDSTTSKVFSQFEPAHLGPHDQIMPRFAAMVLDRCLQDPDWPVDIISTLRLLACGGWAVPILVQQAQNDPDLPSSLSRAWANTGRGESLFPGTWPNGAVALLRSAFVSTYMVERMMNYAMADGTSFAETDDATRAADRMLRSL